MKYKWIFCLVLVVAIITRFYKLGSFPSGLTWDEAAIGYNAYGLVTNHRDEWLHRMPIVFQSFGDYKSPLLVYLTAVSVAILGLTEFAVRAPVAVAGVGLVIVSYFLADEILKRKSQSLFVMMLAALSPWAIQYSRIGFESMLSAFLMSLGTLGMLRWARGSRQWNLILSGVSFAMSLYAYHSAKVVVPLLIILLALRYRKQFLSHARTAVMAIGIMAVLLLPLAYATVYGNANSRAVSTTILSQPHVTRTFLQHMLVQLSPGFLMRGDDLTYRQSTKEIGVLYPAELLLIVVGVFVIIREKSYRQFWWIPSMFIISMIPAALGLDVPHSNRALLGLPWALLTAGIGVAAIVNVRKVFHHSLNGKIVLSILGVIIVMSFVHFTQIYTRVYSSSVALQDFGYGYKETIDFARSKESEVDKVYISNHFGQAYIYLLFYKKLTPIEFRGGGLANYVISDHPFDDAKGHARALVIGTADEIPTTVNWVKEIKYPDGVVRFRIAQQ